MKPKLYVLVGNIASGKSTFAQMMSLNGAFVVDADTIVNMYHGGRYKLYDEQNKKVYHKAEEEMIKIPLLGGKDVIISRLNHKRKTRLRWIKLAKEVGSDVVAVKFKWESPEIHAKRRMDHDSRGLTFERWLSVAISKHNEREWINPELEKYDKIIEYEKVVK